MLKKMTLFAGFAFWSAMAMAAEPIESSGALIRLIEQVEVPAQEAGVLASIHVREGQMVAKGELLAQETDSEAVIAQERAKLELDIATKNTENDVKIRFAKKATEVAKAELQRSMASVDKYKKSVSESELDRLRLIVEKSVLEIEQAEHEFAVAGLTKSVKQIELRAAEAAVARRRIVAPLAGMVVQVARRPGEWVKPGDPVAKILRLDRLRAEGFLKASQLSPDLANRPVKVVVALPGGDAEFPGKIVFVHPEIDPVNSQVRIWAEVENTGLRILPGMRAKLLVEAMPGKP